MAKEIIKYGRLKVEEELPGGYWRCVCECGNPKTALAINIKSGKTTSCGCYKRERTIEVNSMLNTTHGESYGREYKSWQGMKDRCYNPNHPSYHNYGKRGITVCADWLALFETFLHDLGKKPSAQHSIDRIDVNGNYSPTNCRWALPIEQCANKCATIYLEYQGQRLPLTEWARTLNVPYSRLLQRYQRGWTPEELLTLPDARYGQQKTPG